MVSIFNTVEYIQTYLKKESLRIILTVFLKLLNKI